MKEIHVIMAKKPYSDVREMVRGYDSKYMAEQAVRLIESFDPRLTPEIHALLVEDNVDALKVHFQHVMLAGDTTGQ